MRKILAVVFFLSVFTLAKGAPSYTFTSPTCGLLGSFTNNSTGANFAYVWDFGDPASGTNNYALNFTKITETHTFTTYGTYKVKLYIINSSSQPVDSVENNITFIAPPNVLIFPLNIKKVYCNGDTVNVYLTATNDPAFKYVWSPAPISTTAPNSVEYRFTHTQIYTVTVTDTTTGCVTAQSVSITFNNCTPLTSQFTFTPPPCGVFDVTFKNTSLISHHFKWYFGDPSSGANDSLIKPDSSSVSHTFSDTGTFYVSLVAYDSLETKKDSSVKMVTIYKKSLSKIYNGDTIICLGTKVNLSGTGLGTGQWSPTAGLSDTFGYTTIASPTLTTTYYLTTNYNGCVAVDSLTITILSKPDPDFNTDTLCKNEFYTFNASNTTYSYYKWDFGTGDTANGISATYNFDTSGIFNVKLYIFNGFCDSFLIKKVVVLDDPIAIFSSDKAKEEITKATFQFSNLSKNATSFNWDFGDLNTTLEISPNHTYQDTGWYRVVLTALNSLGCLDTTSILIRVDNVYKYFVPSAFSPDKGGPYVNEIFKAFGPEGVTKYEMQIYDRWGQEVFYSFSDKEPWEGEYNDGSICPIGNYIYTIRFKDPTGKRLLFKGIVTLIR